MAGSRESLRTTPEEAESSYEPGGSDVVRELSREPAVFQSGL